MNTRRTLSLIATALLAFGAAGFSAHAAAQEFAIDPTHSQVRISWSHAGFSNPGATFRIGEGRLVFNQDEPTRSSVEAHIPVATANTQVPALDEIFQTQYFKPTEHPAISFSSERVEVVNGTEDRYRIHGTLAVNGISRPVTLDATLNRVGNHPIIGAPAIGFEASTTLMRSEFGLDAYVPIVGDQLTVQITVEALEPAALAEMLGGG